MSVWRQYFFALTLLLVAVTPVSAGVETLGQVRLPVPDRGTDSRNEAIAQGLEQVLIRLSGQPAAATMPGADRLLGSPARWVQQFGYETREPEVVDPETQDPELVIDDEPPIEPVLELAVQFDVSAVLSAMERASLPIWSTHRPPVLVWLVIQRPGFGEILSGDQVDPSREALEQEAVRRGLPLMLPGMDDRDRAVITPADIRGRFDQVLDQASQPYAARFRLAAVIYTGNQPTARWRLLDGTRQVSEGELQGEDEQQLIGQLVNAVSDYFVARYTVTAGAGVEQRLTVRGISNLNHWRTLEQFLSGLAGMRQARLAAVNGDEVEFALVFGGDQDQLVRLLEVNPQLKLCEQPPVVPPTPVPQPVADSEAELDVSEQAGLPAEVPLPVVCWQS